MTPPACQGRWALFDSTVLSDHVRARALCANCPILTRCLAGVPRGEPISGTWAGDLYADGLKLTQPRGIFNQSEATHLAHVADILGVSLSDILSRHPVYRDTQRVAAWLLWTRWHTSLSAVGRLLSRDHTTVARWCRDVERRPELRDAAERLVVA